MKIACLILLAPVLLLTGCASFLLPSASQLRALATDTNSIDISIKTIYGNVDFRRNMPPGATVPMTFQVQPTK